MSKKSSLHCNAGQILTMIDALPNRLSLTDPSWIRVLLTGELVTICADNSGRVFASGNSPQQRMQ
jgi:hypothetical protein